MVSLLVLLAVAVVIAAPILAIIAMHSVAALRRQVANLEFEVTALRHAARTAAHGEAAPRAAPAAAPPPHAPERPAPAARPSAAAAPPAVAPASRVILDTSAPGLRVAPDTATSGLRIAPVPRRDPEAPDFMARASERAKRWFTTGNVPVKVGMLVLLAGIAALLRYASERGWLRLPIALRLLAVSVVALAALAFAWTRRATHRSFALAVQGGAIGVLLLVVFAAFKRYALIGAAPAFGASVILIAVLVLLAAIQRSRTLALLGSLAGFMAPLWLSSGAGNHVVLFAYYALLNAGILALAFIRAWRSLNLLGFAFTWGIGAAWGVLHYSAQQFASTEPFLLLFFAIYLLVPLLHARHTATRGDAYIDGTLLFGTPLLAFLLQAGLLDGARMPLALNALGLAVLYALLAWWVLRRAGLPLLARAYQVLAIAFATLAVPLAFSARVAGSTFALEGTGLVWLGLAQRRRLPEWTGIALQGVAAFALVMAAVTARTGAADMPIINAACMSALLVTAAGFAIAWLYRHRARNIMALLAYVWAMAWWLGTGVHEIGRFAVESTGVAWLLLLLGTSGWAAAEIQRRAPARALACTTLCALGAALTVACMLGLAVADGGTDQFNRATALGWVAVAVLGARSLWCLRTDADPMAGWTQATWWWLWPTVLSWAAWAVALRFGLADGWRLALLALPWLVIAAMALHRWSWLAVPRDASFASLRTPWLGVVAALLGTWWLLALGDAGESAPWPWIPLLNPLDLAQAALLLLAPAWLRQAASAAGARAGWIALGIAGVALATTITLRGVHQWGGLPWDGALPGSGLAQTSLTVVWSLFGVAGWIAGSRRGQWHLWLGGAVLMGVVLVKLLIIDRGNLGDLLGIGAFIAYGLLCTLLGWVAPVPPRRAAAPGAHG